MSIRLDGDVAAPVDGANAMRLHRLMTGYLSSKALFVAVRLGVFDALATGPATAESVGSTIGLPPRASRVLLLALEGEGIVTRVGDEYGNTPLSSTFLVSDSPRYLGALVRHQEGHFAKLDKLEEALRSGSPVELAEQYTGQFQAGPQVWARQWAKVFRASSQLMADDLAAEVNLDGHRHLVDLGCASCSYSISLARANPTVRITAVDQPAVADVAREFVAEAGMAERVTVQPGDIFRDTFTDCDAALLSHVIQGFDRDRARDLLAHVYGWLPGGGLLIVHSHLPERARVPFPYQFGLILLVNNTQGGEPHGQSTTERWLLDVGFRTVTVADISPISAILLATK